MTDSSNFEKLGLSQAFRTNFTLVIPAYNEAPVVKELISELRNTFDKHLSLIHI